MHSNWAGSAVLKRFVVPYYDLLIKLVPVNFLISCFHFLFRAFRDHWHSGARGVHDVHTLLWRRPCIYIAKLKLDQGPNTNTKTSVCRNEKQYKTFIKNKQFAKTIQRIVKFPNSFICIHMNYAEN